MILLHLLNNFSPRVQPLGHNKRSPMYNVSRDKFFFKIVVKSTLFLSCRTTGFVTGYHRSDRVIGYPVCDAIPNICMNVAVFLFVAADWRKFFIPNNWMGFNSKFLYFKCLGQLSQIILITVSNKFSNKRLF